jgi:LytS/YehU family sensor histidine kinase
MIFIPFIENAFKHGDKKQSNPGINIKLEFDKSCIYFEVKNIIRKIKSEDIEESNGFGLDNLERRLQLAYPNNYKLEIITENNLYITKLNIDMNHDN